MPDGKCVHSPAPYVPLFAMAYTSNTGVAVPISTAVPLPTQLALSAAMCAPLTAVFTATGNSANFTPDLGRPVWVRLSGTWAGSMQLKRSTDGANWYPVTYSDGTVKGVWTGNVNAPITEETCAGAVYRLECTAYTSGTIAYEVRQ